jgi:dihydrofolate reductase
MEMHVSLIVAMDQERGIGKDGRVPWHLSADLRRFKALTMGHHLIVGRKTWVSIGRPLPGRKLVIVTRSRSYQSQDCPECAVVHSLEAALELARQAGEVEAFIGGGGEIYAQALPLADRIYLTQVHTRAGCDVFFPELNLEGWMEVTRKEQRGNGENEHAFTYQELSRVKRSNLNNSAGCLA